MAPLFLTFHLIPTMQEFLVQDKTRAASSVYQPSQVCTHRTRSPSHPANNFTKPNTYRGMFYFLAKNIAGFGFQILASTKYCTKKHLMWTVNH